MAYDIDRAPGAFAKAAEKSHSRVAFAFLVLGVLPLGLAGGLLMSGSLGVVQIVGLVGAQYMASRFFDLRLHHAVNWGKGGNAEAAVGDELSALYEEGFVVLHDLEGVVGGNIDHLVSGPTGVFMVETKFRRYQNRDLGKAKSVAHKLSRDLDVAWVQPVICFGSRSYGPVRVKGVAVVGREQLNSYLRAQKNPTVSFDRLARFADGQ